MTNKLIDLWNKLFHKKPKTQEEIEDRKYARKKRREIRKTAREEVNNMVNHLQFEPGN